VPLSQSDRLHDDQEKHRKSNASRSLGRLGCLALAPGHAAQPADGTPAGAAAAQTATLTGRVQNVVTGQYLNNARVAVRGTASWCSPTKPAPTG